MSVVLSTITGQTTVSEYAATSITFNRNMVLTNGILVPTFTGNINYNRTDYLLDASGNKISTIQQNSPGGMGSSNNNYWGNINISAAQLETLAISLSGSITSTSNVIELIAAAADSLIQADLVSRGILQGATGSTSSTGSTGSTGTV